MPDSDDAAIDWRSRASLHAHIAHTFLQEGRKRDAAAAFAEQERLVSAHDGARSLQVADVLAQQGEAYFNYNVAEYAEDRLRCALDIRDALTPHAKETAYLRHQLARLALQRHDAKLAISYLMLAIKNAVDATLGDEDVERDNDDRGIDKFSARLRERERRAARKEPWIAHMLADYAMANQEGSAAFHTVEIYDNTIGVHEAVFGPNDRRTGRLLSNAGSHFSELGMHDRSRPLLRRAAAILRQEDDGDYLASVLHNLAADLRRTGDNPDETQALLRECIERRERMTGPMHRRIAMPLRHLAYMAAEAGRIDDALDKLQRAAAIEEHWSARLLSMGSEHERENAVAFLHGHANAMVAFHLRFARAHPRATLVALEVVLRARSRVLETLRDEWCATRAASGGNDVVDRWRRLLEDEARWFYTQWQATGDTTKAQYRDRTFDALRHQREDLERSIGLEAADAVPDEAGAADFVSSLPDDVLAVLFFRVTDIDFRFRAKRSQPPDRYVAYIACRDGEPQVFDLHDCEALDAEITALRRCWGSAASSDQAEVLLRQLYNRLIAPFDSLIGERTTLLLDTCGALSQVPFAALRVPDGRYLIERCRVEYTVAARAYAYTPAPRETRSAPVVLAGIDYGVPGDASPKFAPLPGTAQESKVVQQSLPGATVWRGQQATKQRLATLRAPSILHVATHGFFLPDLRTRATRQIHAFSGAPSPSPLLRCGLALSGANEGADGILTALEACGLDLDGTRLVVLSSCVSSLSDAEGDSVYGLPRALLIAGAQAVVASLFAVPDAATCELMARFYLRWAQRTGSVDALRGAQLELLRSVRWKDPVNWASFIHIGHTAMAHWQKKTSSHKTPEPEE